MMNLLFGLLVTTGAFVCAQLALLGFIVFDFPGWAVIALALGSLALCVVWFASLVVGDDAPLRREGARE